MKTAAIISTLAAAAMAAPAPRQATPFYGVSIHSGSSIQYASINANGNAFYLGKSTSSYCPTEVVDDCPAGNGTSFTGGDGTLDLSVEVPGGQQVYVAADGSLGFTVAHSGYIPTGANTTGFAVVSPNLQYNGNDWVACQEETGSAVYKIFAAAVDASPKNCTAFAFYTQSTSGVGAWEYE
ncbi:hypothetical protein MBLNU459_g3371t1 [Dothideomycetes sp. NU459]